MWNWQWSWQFGQFGLTYIYTTHTLFVAGTYELIHHNLVIVLLFKAYSFLKSLEWHVSIFFSVKSRLYLKCMIGYMIICRPDHNLQDVRAKIFPLKRRKVTAQEVMPSVSVPVRRKERSLSSLVVSTPRVSTQTGLTGRRTKSVARRTVASRGSCFSVDEPVKKDQDTVEEHPQRSSSTETLNKTGQNRRQVKKGKLSLVSSR